MYYACARPLVMSVGYWLFLRRHSVKKEDMCMTYINPHKQYRPRNARPRDVGGYQSEHLELPRSSKALTSISRKVIFFFRKKLPPC